MSEEPPDSLNSRLGPGMHTASQVADRLRISRKGLYTLAREGVVPCVRVWGKH